MAQAEQRTQNNGLWQVLKSGQRAGQQRDRSGSAQAKLAAPEYTEANCACCSRATALRWYTKNAAPSTAAVAAMQAMAMPATAPLLSPLELPDALLLESPSELALPDSRASS